MSTLCFSVIPAEKQWGHSRSISLADELVILLIFVNKHFVNTVTMGKVLHADKMGMQMLLEHCRDSEQGWKNPIFRKSF